MHVRWRAVALVGLLGIPFAAGAPHAVASSPCGDFTAVAAASGMRAAAESPGYLVVERTDAGAPVAQSSLDAFGSSNALASYPYPGDEALSALPLASIPRNTYPLVAQSQYPTTPKSQVATPAINLTATSAEQASSATASSGADASSTPLSSTALVAASTSTTCADDGSVASIGESTVDGLSLGDGALRIGRVHSIAKATIGPDGTPSIDSSLEISQVSIAGQTVGFGPDGFSIAGVAIPRPDNPLASVLQQSGIEMSYIAAAPQPDGKGITAPALQVRTTREITGAAPTVVTLTFGRSYAGADGAGAGAPPEAGTDSRPAAGGATPASRPPTAASPSPSVAPRPATRTGSGPTVPAIAPATSQPGRAAGAAPAVEPIATSPFSASSIYAVLVVGSLVLLSSGLFFKTVGVRLGWG